MNVRPEFPDDLPPARWQAQGWCLGIFDSGLGGLSVLKALRSQMPEVAVCYAADSGHAPYGDRDAAFVQARSQAVAQFLMGQGIDALVVACNTATASAVAHLRKRWPGLPVIGVEPGVKPAVHHSVNGRIGVLATPLTLASDKFRHLVSRFERDAAFVLQPCPGLAREIEKGQLDSPALRTLVAQFTQPLRDAGVDTVVLGCTHYPLIEPLFRQALGPSVRIVDTSDAVARHVHSTLMGLARQGAAPVPGQALSPEGLGSDEATRLWSSGPPDDLSRAAHDWLGLSARAQPLPS